MNTPVMNERTARLLLALAVPTAAGAVGYLPYLAFKSDLPNPMASHFTSSGVPDGSMSPTSFMFITSVLFVIGAIMCLGVALYRQPLAGLTGVGVASLGGFLCAFASGLLLETVLSQRGLTSWRDASFSWPLTVLALLLGLAGAAAAARLANVLPAQQPVVDEVARPVMDLGVGEQAVWNAAIRSSTLTLVGLFVALFAAFMAMATSQWFPVVMLLLLALVIVSLASLELRADQSGLHVKYGMLPWPRTHVDLAKIASASVIDVRPKQWGGWGYRGSLTVMKRAAVVLRAGPGIRLDLHNGKVFVVTIDNPEPAVGLLNAEIQRTLVSS